MRKIIQIACGMYTQFEEDKDFDDQKYAIVALCNDGTLWQLRDGGWTRLDTVPVTGKTGAE